MPSRPYDPCPPCHHLASAAVIAPCTSVISASLVKIMAAIEAEFAMAPRVTFAGSKITGFGHIRHIAPFMTLKSTRWLPLFLLGARDVSA